MTRDFSKDYYAVLGVPATASAAEIKTEFRKLARQYHPDVSQEPDAEEHFKAINEAYQILGDEQLRGAFDRARENQSESGTGIHVENSGVNFNVSASQAEAEAMGSMNAAFQAWDEYSRSNMQEDIFKSYEGHFYRLHTRMSKGDKPGFSRTYQVKINDQWHDIDAEVGDVWKVLRQWRDLTENLLFKAHHYSKEGGYPGDYGDIDEAFENLNLFLFSRAYLATITWMNHLSPEGAFRSGEEKVAVLRYGFSDPETILEAQRYFAAHKESMPTPPLDPYKKKDIEWGDEGNQVSDREGGRARIIFGAVQEVETSDGINIPGEGQYRRIVWGDEPGNIQWNMTEGEGAAQQSQSSEGRTTTPTGYIEWG